MQTGQTDVTKLIVDFRNFANAPKSDEYFFLVFDTVLLMSSLGSLSLASNRVGPIQSQASLCGNCGGQIGRVS